LGRTFIFGFLTLLFSQPTWGRTLELSTNDGVKIHASMSGRGSQGVLLIHGRDRSSVVWKLFAEKLIAKGVRVLTIDLRGHGDSAKAPQTGDDAFPSMIHDVQAGLKALQQYELKDVSIVGADIGANLALQVAAENPSITNLVLLSPGFNIKGLKASGPFALYGERPIFLAASNGDDYSKKTVTYLKSKATGQSKMSLTKGSATGAQLLEENPDLEDSVLQWLQGNFETDAAANTKVDISIKGVDKMKSTGTSFGE
jgi:alpha-beta hydrolase superfamily lysophospholipase